MNGDGTLLSMFRRDMERRALRPGSIDSRMRVLIRCQDWLKRPLIEADTADLVEWLDRQRVSHRARYAYTSHLACFWRWALLEGHADSDPTRRIIRPKVRAGLPRPVASADLRFAIDNAPDTRVRAMLCLAAYAGARCCEIAALLAVDVMEHLDPPSVLLHGKGGKDRVVPMNTELLDALRRHGIPSRGLVFRLDDGAPVRAWKVSHMLRQHLHDCGINATGHQLRHWFGTNTYVASGYDLRLTQELMGHASPNTTAGYTKLAQARAAEVVAKLEAA